MLFDQEFIFVWFSFGFGFGFLKNHKALFFGIVNETLNWIIFDYAIMPKDHVL